MCSENTFVRNLTKSRAFRVSSDKCVTIKLFRWYSRLTNETEKSTARIKVFPPDFLRA